MWLNELYNKVHDMVGQSPNIAPGEHESRYGAAPFIRLHAIDAVVAALLAIMPFNNEARAAELEPVQILELPPEPQSKALELNLDEPSSVNVHTLRASGDCWHIKAVISHEDRFLIDGEHHIGGEFQKDPAIAVVLPRGRYRLSFSDRSRYTAEEKPPAPCVAVIVIETADVPISEKYEMTVTDDPTDILQITRRLMETNLLETVSLASISVRSRTDWTGGLLKDFLEYYCKYSQSEEEDGLGSNSENKEYTNLEPFFVATLKKYIMENFNFDGTRKESSAGSHPNWLEPADLVCKTQIAGLDKYSLLFTDTLKLLESKKSVRYLISYNIANVDLEIGQDYEFGLNSVYVQTALAFADALGVSLSEISAHISKGNCSHDIEFLSLTKSVHDLGMCLASSSNSVKLADFMGSIVSDKPRLISGPVTSLKDAVTSVLPADGFIEWLDQDELGVRVKVRNVRNWVSSSSNYWERAFITAALLGTRENTRLLVVVDGSVCTGAGSLPPAEENCLKSMDTVTNYNLSEFAKIISGRIAAALVHR